MIKASAPGKLILFGEHAVVYDRPCIVASVEHRISVSLKKRNDNNIFLTAPDLNFKNQDISSLEKSHFKKSSFILAAIRNFFKKYDVKFGLDIKTQSEFSDKIGLGSSSAVVVSAIKGLSELFKIKMNEKDIFDLSYQTVLDVQGLGSGFDVAAAVYGGILFFVTGGKIIKPIEITDMPLVVGYTGVKADTPTLVKMVGEKLLKEPERINGIFNEIENIVNLAKVEIENKDWKKVGHLMNLNQDLLRKLGVSSKKLESLIKVALDSGAYGAKLSGAGGGDCMIVLSDRENLNSIKKAIEKAGGVIIETKIPAEGVRTLS
ncbi:MAG: mevalonate kinase [Patescibacteria group bacterium]|nr:mevalonate kinase [Patescibacteria group bacterium]